MVHKQYVSGQYDKCSLMLNITNANQDWLKEKKQELYTIITSWFKKIIPVLISSR